MNSESNAPKLRKKRWKLNGWHILLFTVLFLASSIFFFPKELLIDLLINHSQSSQLAVMYLRNLVVLYPKDAKLHFALAEQEFELGYLDQAENALSNFLTMNPQTDLEWKMLNLYIQIIHSKTYAFPKKSNNRLQGEIKIRKLLEVLVRSPILSENEAKNLAKEALGVNRSDLTIAFYKRVIAIAPRQSTDFFAHAGQVALFSNNYLESGHFFILAMKNSPNLDKKREYYTAAIKSMIASGQSKLTMEFAEKNIDGLKEDQQTLILLAKIAMSAGEGKFSEKYIKKALKLKYHITSKKSDEHRTMGRT